MKKITKVLVCIVAAMMLVLSFAFAGCSKENSVIKAYENAGYDVVVENGDEAYSKLSPLLEGGDVEDYSNYDYITCTKGAMSNKEKAIIIKFPSAKELKKTLGIYYDSTKSTGIIKGDCYLLESTNEAFSVFNPKSKALSGKAKAVKKKFEAEDYEVEVISGYALINSSLYSSDLSKYMYGESTRAKMLCSYITCIKGSDRVNIFVFPSKSKLKQNRGSTYRQEKKDGKVKGNCYFLSGSSKAEEIFKGIK